MCYSMFLRRRMAKTGKGYGLPGMGLIAHLGDEAFLFGDLLHEACLMDGPSKRFLGIAMLAHLHG